MPWENTWLAAPTRYTAIRARAEERRRAGEGHQRDARRLRLLARDHLDHEAGGRRQERAPRRADRAGHEARGGGGRRHRRLQRDGRRVGDRHPRAGRQGRHRHSRRAREAARSRASRSRRPAWCRPAPRSASTPPSAKASRASASSASPTPTPTARRSPTTSRARPTTAPSDGRPRRQGGRASSREKILKLIESRAAVLLGDRRAVRRLRLPDRRARARQAARRREAVAGRARPHVRARIRLCRKTSGKDVMVIVVACPCERSAFTSRTRARSTSCIHISRKHWDAGLRAAPRACAQARGKHRLGRRHPR